MPQLSTDEKLFVKMMADHRTTPEDRAREILAMQRSRPSRFTHLVMLSARYMRFRMRNVWRDV